MKGKLWGLLSAVSLAFLAGAGQAHHGAGVYDTSDEARVSVTGTITNFRFINPHVLIYASVMAEDGTVVEWSGELTSPNRLARSQRGGLVRWHKTILQPGDTVELSGNPARNGAPSLRLTDVVKFVDGEPQRLYGEGS